MIRRRTAADGWAPTAPLNTVSGVFGVGPDELRIARPVTPELLRGSSQSIHPALAAALGVHPGRRRTLAAAPTAITVVWNLSTVRGPALSSLRPLALSVDAEAGDTLVLVITLPEASVHADRIPADTTVAQRLPILLGHHPADPAAALAAALHCPPAELPALLERRGEPEPPGALARMSDPCSGRRHGGVTGPALLRRDTCRATATGRASSRYRQRWSPGSVVLSPVRQ